jgi:RNA polymerase sigma factor (sigma-70 family)
MGDFDQQVRDLARGDPRAAAALLRTTFADDLQRFLARKVPGSARDDLAGQVWLAVVEGVAGFQGTDAEGRATKARTWLFGIASNKAADFLRRRQRRGLEETLTRLLESGGKAPSPLVAGSSDRPSRRVVAAEEHARAQALVAELMEELKPRDRLLLSWRYLDEEMPDTWVARIEREGCAAALDVEDDMARYRAAEGPEREVIRARLTNLLTQRVVRLLERVAKARRKLVQQRRAEGAG